MSSFDYTCNTFSSVYLSSASYWHLSLPGDAATNLTIACPAASILLSHLWSKPESLSSGGRERERERC